MCLKYYRNLRRLKSENGIQHKVHCPHNEQDKKWWMFPGIVFIDFKKAVNTNKTLAVIAPREYNLEKKHK